jgi:replicative DNA helicase
MNEAPPDLRKARSYKSQRASDRLPPNSPETEQAVLGCILLDPDECMPKCIEKLKQGSQSFYDMRHQIIYDTMVELYDDAIPVDVVSLCDRLKTWDKLENVGGMGYIALLPDSTPSSSNLDYYLTILLDKSTQRRMIQASITLVDQIYNASESSDPKAALEDAEKSFLRAIEDREFKPVPTIRELVSDSMENILAQYQNRTQGGLATGYADFDRLTGGLKAGEMVVIAARPSLGKTSLAMNIVDNVAVTDKVPTGVFSLEMTARSLTERMICSRSRSDINAIRSGFMSEQTTATLTRESAKISTAPLYIDDTSGLTILELRSKARRMVQRYGIKLVVIDYLQLLVGSGTRKSQENRQQEVSDISTGIKNLAKELGIPALVLCQLNRDIERDKNRKPRMSDIRESGTIEQDADIIGMLYSIPTKEGEDEDYRVVSINMLIAKNRNGPQGEVPLTFIKTFTRFEPASRVDGNEAPTENSAREQSPTEAEVQPALPYSDQP